MLTKRYNSFKCQVKNKQIDLAKYIKLYPYLSKFYASILFDRQACAIESAALLNPNWDVFVLSAAPVGLPNNTHRIPTIIRALQTYPNIFMRNINLWTYAANTPLAEWFSTDELFTSQYLNSHISDFLRYVSLYKFGGTYLDLDVVVQKTFENLTANYAGAESANFVAAGVINFQHDGIGHEIADMCVRYVEY